MKFVAAGLSHFHIYTQTRVMLEAGATLAGFHETDDRLAGEFAAVYPQAPRLRSEADYLEDESIRLVLCAAMPRRRAEIAITAMEHGKDVMVDKPAFVSDGDLENVRAVQARTGRIFSVFFSERFIFPAVTEALRLVRSGAIGKVINTVGLGPHRVAHRPRPEWFFSTETQGGILNDLASHQIDQFLMFAQSDSARVVSSQVGNFSHPDRPRFEDFGDLLLETDDTRGYVRVDWYTPAGLGSWGDNRLVVLGTDGYIELRKTIDPAGRDGSNHLILVDAAGTRRIDAAGLAAPYAAALLFDIANRTETAMPQAHCFTVCRLALEAQQTAVRRGYLDGAVTPESNSDRKAIPAGDMAC